jgi:sensor histidine kinase YesM
MFIVGMIIAYLLALVIPNKPSSYSVLNHYLLTLLITFIVWEGNLHIDHWLNVKIPWLKAPRSRLFVQFFVALFYSSIAVYIPMKIYNVFICIIPADKEMMLTLICLVVGIIVSIILLTIEISTQFFNNWKSSMIDVERYKTESVQAQLHNLKMQVNPHFLFNNLSVLSSLVYKDQAKAVDFINQLSKVYRYLLDSHTTELITLEEEMNFIRAYIYLLEIRFDTSIRFDIEISTEALFKLIQPMSLQILVENTIKHNEASERMPLNVKISANDHVLEISNNLQLRTNLEPSSKSGLTNIKDRYKYYTNVDVQVYQDSTQFKVILPLLKKS